MFDSKRSYDHRLGMPGSRGVRGRGSDLQYMIGKTANDPNPRPYIISAVAGPNLISPNPVMSSYGGNVHIEAASFDEADDEDY